MHPILLWTPLLKKDWCRQIPPFVVLSNIVKHLKDVRDRAAMSSVCRFWRSHTFYWTDVYELVLNHANLDNDYFKFALNGSGITFKPSFALILMQTKHFMRALICFLPPSHPLLSSSAWSSRDSGHKAGLDLRKAIRIEEKCHGRRGHGKNRENRRELGEKFQKKWAPLSIEKWRRSIFQLSHSRTQRLPGYRKKGIALFICSKGKSALRVAAFLNPVEYNVKFAEVAVKSRIAFAMQKRTFVGENAISLLGAFVLKTT